MNNNSKLFLLKNLIENNLFLEAYNLREEYHYLNRKIYNCLCRFNFGSALLEIENELFTNIKFESNNSNIDHTENNYENFHNSNENSNESFQDETDWSNYNDDLDMDQQSEDFWNQF